MWDQKVRRLTEEGFKRRPQSPLRRARARFRDDNPCDAPPRIEPGDYAGIGADLRAERERQQRNLADVAAALHIQQRYLEAIEAGRFDDLPGSTYVTGFLRSYGRYLGIDPGDVLAAFREETTMALGPTKLIVPETIAEPRRPRATLVLGSLLAAGVLYAGWAYLNDEAVEVNEAIAPAPERLVGLLSADDPATLATRPEATSPVPTSAPSRDVAPTQDEGPRSTTMVMSDAAAATAREAQRDADAVLDAPAATAPDPMPPVPIAVALPSAPPAEAGEDMPPDTPALEALEPSQPPVPQPPPSAARDAPALPPPPPSAGGGDGYVPQRFGGGDTDARVVVRAKVDSWVQIQDARNETLLTRILRPGDTFYAPNRGDLMLTTGNVGGLEIIVDGEPLGPLGPMGAVRRNISLDAERLLAMAGGREPRR